MKKQLLLFVMMLLPMVVSADEVMIDGINYYINTVNLTAKVIKLPSGEYSGDIIIPSSFTYDSNEYNVNTIGDNAFTSCKNLDKIDFSNLDHIYLGANAFENSSVKEIISSSKITGISTYTFAHCVNLTTIDLSNCGDIGMAAFLNCENLKEVKLSNNRININGNAFKNCTNLENINLSHVYMIGMNAFYNCSKLKSISLSDFTENEIGASVSMYAFKDCKNLEVVKFGKSSIYGSLYISAFEGCDNLSTISLECTQYSFSLDDLNQEPYYGFIDRSFTDFNLPYANVTFKMLGYIADENLTGTYKEFWNKVKIEKIYEDLSGKCGENLEWSLNTKNGILRISGSGDMQEPTGDKNSLTWKNRTKAVKEIIIGENVESICDYAFESCRITSIDLNKRLKTIGRYAFLSTDLETLVLNDSLECIKNCAFQLCGKLKTIKFNEDLKILENGVFTDCSALTSAILPKNLKNLGKYTFAGCSNLLSVTFPYDLKTISEYTFEACKSLTDIYMPALNAPSPTDNGIAPIIWRDITMHIPRGSVSSYQNNPLWKIFKMDEYYTYVNIKNYPGGHLLAQNKKVDSGSINEYLKNGEFLTIEIKPDINYNLKNFLVNEVESQSLLNDNIYIVNNLNENTYIKILYSLHGDVSGDGLVNYEDVEKVKNHIMGIPVSDFDINSANVNNDGVVNAADIVVILKIILNR